MTDILANPRLFALCALVAGSVTLGLSGLLSRPNRSSLRWYGIAVALLVAGSGLLLAVNGSAPGYWLPLLFLPGVWGLGLLLRWPGFHWICTLLLGALAHRQMQAVLTVAIAPLAVLFFTWQAENESRLPSMGDDWCDLRLAAEDVEPLSGWSAQTDRGRPIPLFRQISRTASDAQALERERRLLENIALTQKTIRTAEPGGGYNCHGWTFAGGMCWIRCADAETILADNGYRIVTAAQAGHIVIYRDAVGKIVHSGLIVGFDVSGVALVESKWGCAGRHIHLVAAQCYSQTWDFYRSDRAGHRLRGLESGSVLVASEAGNVSTTDPVATPFPE